MKTTTAYQPRFLPHKPLPFPNAATRRQIWGKVLDLALMAASGMGIAAALLLLLML